MRRTSIVLAIALLGCGEVKPTEPDAPPPDAPPDMAPDAPAACPKTLLTGGMPVEAQGWIVNMQAPATLSYGADHVRLETTTTTGANSGGQLLMRLPGVLPAPPFRVRVELLVERVNTHNQFDAAVGILGSFTPAFGTPTDRGQMIYLDAAAIGWADDTQSVAATILNNAYHTVELFVDAAAAAQVTLDGAAAFSRANFVSNGILAIGDQTNDKNVDGAMRVRSVTLLCP